MTQGMPKRQYLSQSERNICASNLEARNVSAAPPAEDDRTTLAGRENSNPDGSKFRPSRRKDWQFYENRALLKV